MKRTSAVADGPLGVVPSITVLTESDLNPSSTVRTHSKLAVGVQGHKRQRLSTVIDCLVARHTTPSKWNSHCIKVGDMALITSPCRDIRLIQLAEEALNVYSSQGSRLLHGEWASALILTVKCKEWVCNTYV